MQQQQSSWGLCFSGQSGDRPCEYSAGRLGRTGQGILPYIPAPTLPGTVNNYTDNSQKNTWNDDKYGLKVDFVNKTTGNWSFYYAIDDSTVDNALPFASVPGFPSNNIDRAQQFVMSNAKTFGATAVNEARFSFFRTAFHIDNPAGSFASLSSLGFVTGAGRLGIIPSTTPGNRNTSHRFTSTTSRLAFRRSTRSSQITRSW